MRELFPWPTPRLTTTRPFGRISRKRNVRAAHRDRLALGEGTIGSNVTLAAAMMDSMKAYDKVIPARLVASPSGGRFFCPLSHICPPHKSQPAARLVHDNRPFSRILGS